MVTVAVICEYNPFHSGHQYHFRRIREEFGHDTAIVAIMSGNFTQRGEIAIAPKSYRAEAALECGANLVLELPFPYSSSSAELFASAGVTVADKLGFIDYLSFGSENGDISALKKAAEIIDGEEFKLAFSSLSKNKAMGYPERCEAAYRQIASENMAFTPNNILAIEYIRAIHRFKSLIVPHTVARCGANYNSEEMPLDMHPSAMAIRCAVNGGDTDIIKTLPEGSKAPLRRALELGDFPTNEKRISSAVISSLRLSPDSPNEAYHDAGDGLYNRLKSASFEASDISSLLELSATKIYTNARLRRTMWNIFIGVTSSDVKTSPAYTQVLALDPTGMSLLKSKRKSDDFFVLTKPSDTMNFSDVALRQKLLSDKADSVFELAKPIPKSGKSALRFTPYVKK